MFYLLSWKSYNSALEKPEEKWNNNNKHLAEDMSLLFIIYFYIPKDLQKDDDKKKNHINTDYLQISM